MKYHNRLRWFFNNPRNRRKPFARFSEDLESRTLLTPLLPNNPNAIFFVSPDQANASEQERLEQEARETDGQTFSEMPAEMPLSAFVDDDIYEGFARRRDETREIDEQFIQFVDQIPEWLRGDLDIERDSSVPGQSDDANDQTELLREFIEHMKQHAEALLKGMDEALPIRQWLESIDLIDVESKPADNNAPEAAPDMSQLEALDAYWIAAAETGDWLLPLEDQDDKLVEE